jgi:superfamily I DNA/RNA helicase
VEEIDQLPEGTREKVQSFHRMMTEWQKRFEGCPTLSGRVRELFAALEIEEELYRTIENRDVARRKVENVEQIINSAATYEERVPGATLAGYLEKVSLMDEDRFSGKDKREHGKDAVTLMSLHASKGLEFPVVFLAGLEEDILPHKKSIYENFNIEEERRLCYVGITRAREHLTITRCVQRKKYGKLQDRVPSRFLEEIPPEFVQHHEGLMAKLLTPEESEKMAGDFFAKMKAMLDT